MSQRIKNCCTLTDNGVDLLKSLKCSKIKKKIPKIEYYYKIRKWQFHWRWAWPFFSRYWCIIINFCSSRFSNDTWATQLNVYIDLFHLGKWVFEKKKKYLILFRSGKTYTKEFEKSLNKIFAVSLSRFSRLRWMYFAPLFRLIISLNRANENISKCCVRWFLFRYRCCCCKMMKREKKPAKAS